MYDFTPQFLKKYWFLILEIVLILIVIFAHLYSIDSLPRGLYIDESSIGYNAIKIAESGTDEFGTSWPLYFKAFGEYKNPLYIYTTALLFKIFGFSIFSLRLTSFVFYFLGFIFVYLLTRKIFKDNLFIRIYTILGFGFLPIYFNLSRVSFELISQLTTTAISLYLIYILFETKQVKKEIQEQPVSISSREPFNRQNILQNLKFLKQKRVFLAVLTGLIIGLSIYTYSTARLLTFLFILGLIFIYRQRENWFKLGGIILGSLLAIIPWLIFLFSNPDRLTNRFNSISYIASSTLSIQEKVIKFFTEYSLYFTPNFLLFKGDSNIRHTVGYGGITFFVVFFLFVVGLIYILSKQKKEQFSLFLLFNLLISPIAAALTSDSTPHALRSLLLGLFIFLVSCFGLNLFYETTTNLKKRLIVAGAILFVLLFEIGGHMFYYYNTTNYPNYTELSKPGFESYGFDKALETAFKQNPKKVIVSSNYQEPYIQVAFYNKLQNLNKTQIPIEIGKAEAIKDTCLIYFRGDEEKIKNYYGGVRDFTQPDWVTKLKCFE